MNNFEVAVALVLENEGGRENDKNDAGGVTNFGISDRFLSHLPVDNLKKYGICSAPITPETVDNLTIEQAKVIYRGEFWEKAPFDQIVDPYVGAYIFDMCVNHGIEEGIKLVQRALWAMYEKIDCVADDGTLGAETVQMINNCSPQILEKVLMSERAGYMRLLAHIHSTDEEFLNGWLKRCYRI